ncbi:cytochrome P450 [Athelia psychrophila]|uniref:Cytochrome P450 n=1 Tax=Athelia psychrophila TaxID=1759441 RepID=A0A166T1V4_9AGAM|nr:cytochrome P450 [Fibularhizoctonia sp. CBS 109695]
MSVATSLITQLFKGIQLWHLLTAIAAYAVWKFVYRVYLWPRYFSPLRHLPGPPMGNPIFGQVVTLIKGEVGVAQREWVKQYGPIIRVMGPLGNEQVCFSSPEALQQIFVSDWLDFPRPSYLRKILGLVTGNGLLTVTGNQHKQMRKAMNPAFSIPNLMSQTDMFYDPIEGLVDIFSAQIQAQSNPAEGKEIHVYDWMGKVTLDIICDTAFGYHTDSLHNPHDELAQAYEHLLSLQSGANLAGLIALAAIPGVYKLLNTNWAHNYRSWLDRTPFLAPASTLVHSMHTIKTISAQMLAEKMADSAVTMDDTLAKRDIMSLLVRARKTDKDDGYQMTDQDMMDQVLTFLGAGHETTASGLAWTLWLLANDKDSQDRLREEVTPYLADNPRPSYRTLKEMQWLDCVIMESLRCLPPVPGTPRVAAKDMRIGDVFIPKGTLLPIHIRMINTLPEVWGDDAEEFHPARWLDLPKTYNPTFSMLSFIAGPHGCIGRTMAMIEMKAVLACLISQFEFQPAYAGQVAKPTTAITMKPADGMPLRVKAVPKKQTV